MTNEELDMRIKVGDQECAGELWEQVCGRFLSAAYLSL